jgi:hypothetical protein
MSKSIEESFIDRFSSALSMFRANTTTHPTTFQFLCPYCQSTGMDSKGKKIPAYKAKGYLYPIGNAWNYKCHKCGEHQSFVKFLEAQFPLLHFEYVRLRDQLGTTGFQTNCPSLETLLKKRGMLSGQPPQFHADPKKSEPQRPASPSAVPIPPSPKSAAPVCPPGFKLTIELPMRSPQQQAGHQSRLNHQIKQRQQQRRFRSGERW